MAPPAFFQRAELYDCAHWVFQPRQDPLPGPGFCPLLVRLEAIVGYRLTLLSQVDLSRPNDRGAASVRQVVQRGAFHSAAEGIAIGVGFLVDPLLGLFLAGTLALHNVAEGTAIVAALTARGWSMPGAALLAVGTKSTHIPMAVATAVWLGQAALPAGLGFAAGSMFYLVLVDLLPESYLQRGHTGIAIAASAAISIVVLVEALLLGS